MPDRGRPDESSRAWRPAPQSPRNDLRTAHLWHFQPIRDLLLVAIVAGTVYVGYAMRTVTIPLLVAVALAYLFEPVVVKLTATGKRSRPMAVGLILAALGLGVGVTGAVVVPLAVGQTIAFGKNLRSGKYDGAMERLFEVLPEEYREDVREWTGRLVHPVATAEGAPATESGGTPGNAGGTPPPPTTTPPTTTPQPTTTTPTPSEAVPEPSAGTTEPADGGGRIPVDVTLDNPLVSILGAGTARLYSFAMLVLQLSLALVLIPFYFFYFSVHWPQITGFIGGLVPEERRPTIFALFEEMDRAVAGFVRGRIVICILMGIMFAIGWQICGVPYGIALGLFTGALSIVPYLGGIGLPFAIGLLVADQMSLPDPEARMAVWGMLVWPTVVFVVVQSIEGYLLTPVIAGKATNLDPVTIVVAILAGGSVAGVYGMLLAIPIAACGKILATRILLPRITAWAQGRVSDPLPFDED
ncbi:MAG: hypothetical protein RI967_1073 [Planctomycetota bacterium]